MCFRELVGLAFPVQTLLEQTKRGRIATVRIIKASQSRVSVDLLFDSSGIEAEIVAGAEPIAVFENLFVDVASLPGLLALKVLSVDPLDLHIVLLFLLPDGRCDVFIHKSSDPGSVIKQLSDDLAWRAVALQFNDLQFTVGIHR